MYFHYDRGGFFFPLQLFAKGIRQSHRLQTDAKISAWDMPLLQKRVRDFIYRRSRHRDCAETRETRRRQANRLTVRVDDSATYRSGLQPHVETDVRNE